METGIVTEYVAMCDTCNWKGHKFGNIANANSEASLHRANFRHEEVIVSEAQIDTTKVANNEIGEEEAKLLFIRKSAQEAYEKGEVVESTKAILKTIVEISLVSNMTKEEIGLHIGNLEKARMFLAAFTQGLQIGYAKEAEPIFKAKREKERLERIVNKISGKDKKVNDLIELARSLASKESTGSIIGKASKTTCPKCNKEVFSLEYHTC